MKLSGDATYLSASDLSTHMSCRYATYLDIREQREGLRPTAFVNTMADSLRQKGEEFEDAFIEELKQSGKTVIEIDKEDKKKAAAATIDAMRKGVDVICQARLEHEIWNGWADFLLKVDKPGTFGAWSYEVLDTKLSKQTKAGAILQISLYSEMVEKLQGCKPEYMHIKNPNGEHHFRVDDFAAYYRLMKAKLLQALVNDDAQTYPDPVPHCEVCKWWFDCNKRRRADDHLSFVAGMGSAQIREVNKWQVHTLEQMAGVPVPLQQRPERGSVETFQKLVNQARLQRISREQKEIIHELLPLQEGYGLYKLPEPCEDDIFFDFEGDPFVGTGGLEYLFGWYHKNAYHELWSANEAEEKAALESFIVRVMEIWQKAPGMHIYHFGAYEEAALKRMVGKYASGEEELDALLRAKVFVNLHTVTKQSLMAGVESYSLKDLEKLHGYLRAVDLRTVGPHKALYEGLLESGNLDAVEEETINVVREYNKDDCVSTLSLRDWLEEIRAKLIKKGEVIPRPVKGEPEPPEKVTNHQERIKPIYEALTKDVPFEKTERTDEQQAKWLLANMLDWYRRESKSFWWEIFRLRSLSVDELLEERGALAYLEFTGETSTDKKSMVHVYRFPDQEFDLGEGDNVSWREQKIGSILQFDHQNKKLWVKKRKDAVEVHPDYLYCSDKVPDGKKEEAIIRFAEWVVNNGILSPDKTLKAGRDLLLRRLPEFDATGIEDAKQEALARVKSLDNSVLPIQGPPGTGKSFTASLMILELLKAGKKVGITALSHKVITALLEKVAEGAVKQKIPIKIVQKVREASSDANDNWIETTDNGSFIRNIKSDCNVAAGTSFMWANEDLFEAVDYLFIDEAGQLSLVDTIAVSHAGKNLVLLGDPQQLKQPQQGSHPEGTEVSALEHVLRDQKTITREQGVFLEKTWRMHPAINDFISELFYDCKLETMPGTTVQKLKGSARFDKPEIYFVPVTHSGNQNSSPEEVEVVNSIVTELLSGGVKWSDDAGRETALTESHIKIISPYNAQVNALQKTLPQVQIGTVDKFQGQEAPVIIFSMATSLPEDAPRGMEFLYSLNRLNVAVSRARAVFIMVASPALFEPSCKSPAQMKLVNALCRLKEMAIDPANQAPDNS